jgi:pimeloyl-ACP methyl ester carboxylesterase
VLDEPWESGAFFYLDAVLDQGWAVVATDYIGLGTRGPHPYLIGQPSGRAVLDAVRAARGLDDVTLAGTTVVWGHSQGGGAALWAGVLAPTYAPELGIRGVAALAPASNLPQFVPNLGTVQGGSIFASYAIAAYAAAYRDVRPARYVRPTAQPILEEMAERCLSEPGVLVSLATSLSLERPVWSTDPTAGALGRRLSENVPTGAIDAPLLVAQGATDGIVLRAAQDAYVAARCAAGHPVDYRVYERLGHLGLVERDSPLLTDLLRWTNDRLDGVPVRDTCAS